MSVLIKDMGKPKSCYAVIDGECEYCPFVNTDDDCVLLLKKGTCEGTWADQYSKCPLIEAPELCEDAVSRQAVIDELEKAMCEDGFRSATGLIHKTTAYDIIRHLPSAQPEQTKMIKEIRKWINSGNRGSADYFIVDKIEEIINKYE